MAILLGIDPGRTGALAVVSREFGMDRLVWWAATKDLCPDGYIPEAMDSAVSLAVSTHGATSAVLERVSAMPGQGVTCMFNFGAGWGLWRGILAGRCPVLEPTSASWSKVVLRDIPGADTKQKALARASQVPGWPTGKLAKVRSEGLADAICLCLYGLREVR